MSRELHITSLDQSIYDELAKMSNQIFDLVVLNIWNKLKNCKNT